jgi:putative nucleotidyltransferase with HDIG domain
MSEPLSRDQAWDLFCSWTESESLRRHVLAVEAAMRAYARKFGEDEDTWGLVGMLHDLDYERHPDLETGHPRVALQELERQGFSTSFVRAVASHADFLEVPRETLMEKTLYAVDELSGFVMACAYVRPEGIHGMTPKSVKKKMKTPAFAAAVDRDALRDGADDRRPRGRRDRPGAARGVSAGARAGRARRGHRAGAVRPVVGSAARDGQ